MAALLIGGRTTRQAGKKKAPGGIAPAPKPQAQEPPAKASQGKKRNLADDPIVKKTAELFGGDVFDVRE